VCGTYFLDCKVIGRKLIYASDVGVLECVCKMFLNVAELLLELTWVSHVGLLQCVCKMFFNIAGLLSGIDICK
jgi:hypothetical protein